MQTVQFVRWIALIVNGAQVAIITGAGITIAPTFDGPPVVGSNTIPALVAGPVSVSGSLSAYFQDATLRDLFRNETECSLVLALTSDNTATSKFLVFVLPRIKIGGANKTDGEVALIQTLPFQALENIAGGAGTTSEATTITIQDTDA